MSPRISYKLADGTRVPGVTSISGAYKGSIDGLLHWANRGGLEGKSLDDLYGLSTVPGTIVHAMIEAHVQGKPFVSDPAWTPEQIDIAENSFLNFLTWWDQNEVRPVEVEPHLISEELRCGGTPDLAALVHGKRCLIDWKSGKPLAYTSTLLQLAAYGMMWEEIRGSPIEGYYIVVIPRKEDIPTFTVQYRESMPELARKQFRLLREAYENEKALKKCL